MRALLGYGAGIGRSCAGSAGLRPAHAHEKSGTECRAPGEDVRLESRAPGTPERRSGQRGNPRDRRLPAGVEAHLRGMIGTADMLGDQLDIVRRDGLVAIGPVHDLLQQLEVQGRELRAMLGSCAGSAGLRPAHAHEKSGTECRAPGQEARS